MQGRPLEREGLTEFVDAQIALFSKGSVQHYRQRGNESDLPVLVVGMMRTGTTLAEQILSCHPQIGGAGEQTYWGDRQPQLLDVQARRIDQLFLRGAATKYVELLQGLAPGFSRVIDKNPANVLLLGLIHSALPNARSIHMLRNPVDTALSIWTTPMRTTAPFVSDRSDIVFAFKEYLRLAEHFRQVLPEDRFTEMPYEELTSDPEPSIKRLAAFLGLEWNEACLRPEANPRAVRTPSVWQVRQPIHGRSQDRRRNYAPWLREFAELERAAEA